MLLMNFPLLIKLGILNTPALHFLYAIRVEAATSDRPPRRAIVDARNYLAHDDKVVGSAYAGLRDKLEAIAEGRSGRLPLDQVTSFSRLYREQLLRAEIGATSGSRRVP